MPVFSILPPFSDTSAVSSPLLSSYDFWRVKLHEIQAFRPRFCISLPIRPSSQPSDFAFFTYCIQPSVSAQISPFRYLSGSRPDSRPRIDDAASSSSSFFPSPGPLRRSSPSAGSGFPSVSDNRYRKIRRSDAFSFRFLHSLRHFLHSPCFRPAALRNFSSTSGSPDGASPDDVRAPRR